MVRETPACISFEAYIHHAEKKPAKKLTAAPYCPHPSPYKDLERGARKILSFFGLDGANRTVSTMPLLVICKFISDICILAYRQANQGPHKAK